MANDSLPFIPIGRSGPHHSADEVEVADMREESIVALPEALGSMVRGLLVSQCQRAGFLRASSRRPRTPGPAWPWLPRVGVHLTTATAVEHLPHDGVRTVEVRDLSAISVFLLWREDDDDPALHRVLRTSEQVLAAGSGDH